MRNELRKIRNTGLRFWLWLKIPHGLVCNFWNWRLPPDLNENLEIWEKIDHRKDKSYTGRSFRAWFYMRKVDEHKFNRKKI